jgi:hypothetical protein
MVKAIQEALPADKAPELAKRLQEGKFSLRDMYEQLQNIMKMGPINKGVYVFWFIFYFGLMLFSFGFVSKQSYGNDAWNESNVAVIKGT